MAKGTLLQQVVIILLIQRSLSLVNSPQKPAQVNNTKPVTVSRGGYTDLKKTFRINPTDRDRPGCEIRYIHKTNLTCGQVIPNVFSCKYEGAVYYQHFGCFGDKQLVTLQLSVVPVEASQVNNSQQNAIIQIFSVELQVKGTDIYSDVRLVQVNSSSSETTHMLVFPNHLIGKCHYELVFDFNYLKLPSHGELSAEPDTILPCGLAPSKIRYKQNSFSANVHDYVLLRFYSYTSTNAMPIYLIIAVNGPTHYTDVGTKLQYTQSSLLIQQAINTPVPPDKFIVDAIQTFGLHPIKYQVEVHPSIGSFRTPVSTDVNVSFTEFTREELIDGCVSFYPHFTELGHLPVNFHYSVILDAVSGESVAGIVTVTLQSIAWEWPAQRTNNPLQVFRSQRANIDCSTIDFYRLNDCESQTTMHLSVLPQHGHLIHQNGSLVSTDTTFFVEAVRNGAVLAYEQSGDEAMYDQMIWQVKCLDAPSMSVSLAVWIAQTWSTTSPTCVNTSKVFVYNDWSRPLSLSDFGVTFLGSTVEIDVIHMGGTLLKATHSLAFTSYSWWFPFVKVNLHSPTQVVKRFTPSELQQQLIWYVPPKGALHDVIEFRVIDKKLNQASTMCSSSIEVSQQHYSEMLVIGTAEDNPFVQTVSMTLPIAQTVYITSHYLSSALPPFLESSIKYFLLIPPQNGSLCILSNEPCESSVSQFSQQDISKQLLFFSPSSNFTREELLLEITINGIRSYNPNLVKLKIKLKEESAIDIKTPKLFVVRAGRERRIRGRHFPRYSKTARFRVTQGTAYGRLSYRDGSENDLVEFTRRDIVEDKVWYTHDSTATFSCSDSFQFEVISKNGVRIGSHSFIIVIAQGKKYLDVNISAIPYHFFSANRFLISKRYFQISSSFCPEFVVFSLKEPPCYGVLSLADLTNNLVYQLHTNSTFTARDVYSGLVYYTIIDSNPQTSNISDKFVLSASDPVSEWPQDGSVRQAGTGHIRVLIDTVAGTETLDLKVTSPRPVSWLPDYNVYGAVLGRTDIDISNSTVSSDEVNIQVHLNIKIQYRIRLLDSSSVSVFTLAEMYSGQVLFTKMIFQPGSFQDTVKFDVLVEIEGQNRKTTERVHGNYSLNFTWVFADIDIETSSVTEETGNISFHIRRRGEDLWFESSLLFRTFSDSAIGTNCSESDTVGFDFCHVTEVIVFEPNVTEYIVTVKLVDDGLAERDERFMVQLSEPENVVLNEGGSGSLIKIVTIVDQSDYALVRFEGDAVLQGFPCQVELRNVDEGIDVLAINISRSGNTKDRVGILCRTDSEFSVAEEDFDFVGRSEVVWFQPNQTSATCNLTIINDIWYESAELVHVILEAVENGRALPDQDYADMCVFIGSDINDEPEVSFNVTEIIVQESETQKVNAHFVILRRGLDLSSKTVVLYVYEQQPSATATFGEDFTFSAGDSDPIYCMDLTPGVGCVVFTDESSIETVNFTILPDSIFEGNETFYLKIKRPVHMGHPGYLNILKVTIVDASQPAVVRFETVHTNVSESMGWTSVDVLRTGNLMESVSVTCVFKARTASLTDDVLIAHNAPEVAHFASGQTRSSCPFRVNNDEIYELEEQFEIFLETSSVQVMIPDNFSSVIVSILDPEDIPVVQFTEKSLFATEPLSNYNVDSQSVNLTIVRTGDPGLTVAVQYTLIEGTAVGGVDYSNRIVHGIVLFLGGVTELNVSVQLKANHQSNENTNFSVLLFEITMSSYVNVGANNSVVVSIQNTEVFGPILPGKPVVINNGQLHTSQVYHDSPLHCYMPCSSGYEVDRGEEAQYLRDCRELDLLQTIFMWEYSLNGEEFHLFNATTVLTSVNSKILDPIYLSNEMFVRCLCTPVNNNGRHGHPRTSEVVRLGGESRCARDTTAVEVVVSSYATFGARSEDLVEISVSLPRISNYLPLVVTHSLEELNIGALLQTTTDVNASDRHVCTSINNFKMSSRGDLSWYSTLNYTSCTWIFRLWIPLGNLQHHCEANVSFTDSVITLGLHVTYISLNEDQNVKVMATQSVESQLQYKPSNLYLPPPLHYHPADNDNINENLFIYPIAVESASNTIYFYSSSKSKSTGFNPTVSSQFSNDSLTLLYYDVTQEKMAWMLSVTNPISMLDTTITLYEGQECGILDCIAHRFRLKFKHSCAGALTPVLGVNRLVGRNISGFSAGDVLFVSLRLEKHQKIQQGFFLAPVAISLLNTTDSIEIWNIGQLGTLNSDAIHFINDPKPYEVSFQIIKLELLVDLTLVVSWALASKNGTSIITQSTDVDILFAFPPDPTVLNDTQGLSNSLEAAVAIFVVTFVIAAATFTTIGIFIWIRRVRKGLKKKIQQAQTIASQKKHVQKLQWLSGGAFGTTKLENCLHRTHSTTGFPATVENYKRQKYNRQTLYRVGRKEVTAMFTQHSITRSRSLPNLNESQFSALSIEGFSSEQRRNLNKVHTRVKKLNSQHAEAQKSSSTAQQRLLHANKVDNLKTSQDITPKQNNYGVNEGKLNTEKKDYKKELASFAVRSIAASAKTPEPGSTPRTVL